LTVRHYYSAAKQRKDTVYVFNSCPSTHGQTDLEVIYLDLAEGLLLSRRTDFYLPGPIPLELSRVVRTMDNRSRAFGIGGNHSLNIFPVGNQWPFTWIDLILEDGGRFHYRRMNWGASYWDAAYRVQRTISDFYDSTLAWNWPGWKLDRQDGLAYYFPDGNHVQRPEQAALIGIRDSQGNALKVKRERSGNIASASSSSGQWIRFQYDPQNRITVAHDDEGHEVHYRYNSAGCLEEVEDAEHHHIHYAHDSRNRITGIDADGQTIVSVDFDEADRVNRMQLASGETYRFSYIVARSGAIKRVDITDPAGKQLRLKLENSGYTVDDLSAQTAQPTNP
jgi:YD repeat-containing protein